MDLNSVGKMLKKGHYKHVEDCLNDIQLVFENSWLYNEGNKVLFILAFSGSRL
jgi:hypothetical protein